MVEIRHQAASSNTHCCEIDASRGAPCGVPPGDGRKHGKHDANDRREYKAERSEIGSSFELRRTRVIPEAHPQQDWYWSDDDSSAHQRSDPPREPRLTAVSIASNEL